MTSKTLAVLLVLIVAAGAHAACGKSTCGKPSGDAKPAMMPGCGSGGPGCGMMQAKAGDGPAQLTLEDQRKALDDQVKCLRETAQLRLDLQVKGLELRKLWLYDDPDAGKIASKLNEIFALRKQLGEKCRELCPAGGCGMGHGRGMMGGMMGGCGGRMGGGMMGGTSGCQGGGCGQ